MILSEIIAQLEGDEHSGAVLSSLRSDDPFWVGASYAIDPFVGVIVRLPLRDPRVYGGGVEPAIFDKIAKSVLSGDLKGDALVIVLERFSRACTEPEWTRWYRPILEGKLNLRLSLATFNQHCPDGVRIPPPALNQPRPIGSMADLPARFVLQPLYPDERVFWLVNSKTEPFEIRGYDAQCRRFECPAIEAKLAEIGGRNPIDVVLTGFVSRETFLAEDILTRDQFAQESGANPLSHRLAALLKLNLPTVQLSDELSPRDLDGFYRELNLILEQRFDGAIIRPLDGHYPFRAQPDLMIRPASKAIVTCIEVVPGIGLRAVQKRGNKSIGALVRLGLTQSVSRDISERSAEGRQFDILSCGIRENEHLFPTFKRWRN